MSNSKVVDGGTWVLLVSRSYCSAAAQLELGIWVQIQLYGYTEDGTRQVLVFEYEAL